MVCHLCFFLSEWAKMQKMVSNCRQNGTWPSIKLYSTNFKSLRFWSWLLPRLIDYSCWSAFWWLFCVCVSFIQCSNFQSYFNHIILSESIIMCQITHKIGGNQVKGWKGLVAWCPLILSLHKWSWPGHLCGSTKTQLSRVV